RNDEYGFYALSRHDDVMAASTDWRRYSSARGTVLELIDGDRPSALVTDDDIDFDMMIFMDPPAHDAFRRLVSRAFTPRRAAGREARIGRPCADYLDPHVGGGRFDFVDEVAARIPTMVIGDLLGVPVDDQDQLRLWGDLMMRYEPDRVSPEKLEAIEGLYG